MAVYQVRFFSGNYKDRQFAANAAGAVCYVEQHFNSTSDPSVNRSLVIVAANAGDASLRWGRMYSAEVARRFGIPDGGVIVGGFGGRGNGNLRHTDMPAILLEPFFLSNADGAAWARDPAKQDFLADILADTIRRMFPDGGLVAFSVGHKGKVPDTDRGARAVGGGFEAEFAEQVLLKAERLLEAPHGSGDRVSEWAEGAHNWVVANKISDGSRPQEPVTREEVWAMLHRATGAGARSPQP